MFNHLKYELLNLSNTSFIFDEFRIKCRLRKALAGEFDDIQEVKNLRFKDPNKYNTYKKVYFFVKTISNITSKNDSYASRIEIEKEYSTRVAEGFTIISDIINRTVNSIKTQKERQRNSDNFNFNENQEKTRAEEVYNEMINYVYDRADNLRKINNEYIKNIDDLNNYINDMYIKNKYQNILKDRELLLNNREKLALDRMKLSEYQEKFLKESEDQLNDINKYEYNMYDTSNKPGRNNELSSDLNNDSLLFELSVHYYVAVCICSFYFTKYITKNSNKFNGAFFSVIKNITKEKYIKYDKKPIIKEETIEDVDTGYKEIQPDYNEPKDLVDVFQETDIPILKDEEININEDKSIEINTDDLGEETINAIEQLQKVRQEEKEQQTLTPYEEPKFEDNEEKISTAPNIPILDNENYEEEIIEKESDETNELSINKNKVPIGEDLLTYISRTYIDNIPLNINLRDKSLLILLKLSTPVNLNDFRYMIKRKNELYKILQHNIFSENYKIE